MIIAVYNIKGGVGKTSTSINLAFTAAQKNRVLLIDLDIQGASSYFFHKRPKRRQIYKRYEKIIKHSSHKNIDIIPADTSLEQYKHFIKPMLDSFKEKYDLIIIDAPATLNTLTKDIVRFSDIVLVPALPNILSLRTYNQLIEQNLNKNIKIFINGFEKKPTHLEIVKKILSLPKSQYLKTYIPRSDKIENMPFERMSVIEKYPKSSITKAYKKLFKEIIS